MSSKHGPSLPRDEYLTPRELVEAAVAKLRGRYPLFNPMTCVEPGCAWGAHLDYSLDYFPSIVRSVGVDIFEQPLAPEHEFVHADYLRWQPDHRYDLVATNPPFSLADDFFRHTAHNILSPAGIGILFERYGFFSSIGRRTGTYVLRNFERRWREGLWRVVHLREVWVCVPRPSMIGQLSSDSCEYAYYVIDAGHPGGDIRLDWLDW
jgi:hypothetical protein